MRAVHARRREARSADARSKRSPEVKSTAPPRHPPPTTAPPREVPLSDLLPRPRAFRGGGLTVPVGVLGAVLAVQAGLWLFGSGSVGASLATTATQALSFAIGTLGMAWFAWSRLASRLQDRE